MKRNALTLAALLLAGQAGAQQHEATRLFARGAWAVDHVLFDDGSVGCQMGSETPQETVAFWVFPVGGMQFQVWNPSWNLAKRTVTIYVDVDYARFNGRAEAEGTNIWVHDLGTDFVKAVRDGRALALFNASGQRLLTYSLQGSAAATLALIDCWSKISTSDPFGGADPFGVADPF